MSDIFCAFYYMKYNILYSIYKYPINLQSMDMLRNQFFISGTGKGCYITLSIKCDKNNHISVHYSWNKLFQDTLRYINIKYKLPYSHLQGKYFSIIKIYPTWNNNLKPFYCCHFRLVKAQTWIFFVLAIPLYFGCITKEY